MWKSRQIRRKSPGQPRAELQLTDDNVTGANPLLREKQDEASVALAKVIHPSVGINQNH
jgi:hypothetical protein